MDLLRALWLCYLLVTGLLMMLLPHTNTAMVSTFQRDFTLTTNITRGVTRIGSGLTTFSPTSCASECLNNYDTCRGFMFKATTGLCTQLSRFDDLEPRPENFEGDLFQILCDAAKGFQILKNDSEEVCVGKFVELVNYFDADISCQNKGGFLVSVKTQARRNALMPLLDTGDFWVGCDDLEEEGTYVWKEDCETFDFTTKPDTFNANEPNNFNQSEDCVSICDHKSWTLNDHKCTVLKKYLCELPTL